MFSGVPTPSAHRVVVVAFDDVVVADLVLPAEVLGRTKVAHGRCPYDVRIAPDQPTVETTLFTTTPPWRLSTLRHADTIVIPGRNDPFTSTPPAVLRALRRAASNGTRIMSICVGAFILAEAGLLDGQHATTHWGAASELSRRYPAVTVDPNVLFVDNGQVLTSAGAAAGFDLLLHLVQRDHGHAIAADTARAVVMPLVRQGGQAQYITPTPFPTPESGLAPLLEWIETNHRQPLTLTDMARHAAISTRTLSRHFQRQTGTSPSK